MTHAKRLEVISTTIDHMDRKGSVAEKQLRDILYRQKVRMEKKKHLEELSTTSRCFTAPFTNNLN